MIFHHNEHYLQEIFTRTMQRVMKPNAKLIWCVLFNGGYNVVLRAAAYETNLGQQRQHNISIRLFLVVYLLLLS